MRRSRLVFALLGGLPLFIASIAGAITVTSTDPDYQRQLEVDAVGGGDLQSDNLASTDNPLSESGSVVHRGITASTTSSQTVTTSSTQIQGTGSTTVQNQETGVPDPDTQSYASMTLGAVVSFDVAELTLVALSMSGDLSVSGALSGGSYVQVELNGVAQFTETLVGPYDYNDTIAVPPGSHTLTFGTLVTNNYDNSGGNPGDGTSFADYAFTAAFTEVSVDQFSLAPDDVVVADGIASMIFSVDPATGDRQIISANVVGSGPPLGVPTGVEIDADGSILSFDHFGDILRIHAPTGDRSTVSSAVQGSGPLISNALRLRVEADGKLLVLDSDSISQDITNGVIRVDPSTGNRTLLASDAVGTGPAFQWLWGLAIEADGQVLLADLGAAQLLRMDPVTGNRTVLSSATIGTGTVLQLPAGLAVESDGSILVTDRGLNAVLRIDPLSGDRTVVSSSSVGTGPDLLDPVRIALNSNGQAVVTELGASRVLTVDLLTGDRVIISSATVGTGATFDSTYGAAVIPPTAAALQAGTDITGTLLGGTEAVGGFEITFEETTGGVLIADFATPTTEEVNNSGDLDEYSNFEIAGPSESQLWDIDFEGNLAGSSIELKIRYDGFRCCNDDPGVEQILMLLHVPDSGVPEYLSSFFSPSRFSIDTTADVITVTVDSLSPFYLGFILPGCGDLVLDGGEECDDGDVLSGDGCSASCKVEAPVSVYGTAQGGTVEVTIEGVLIVVATTASQSAESVLAALVDAIDADPTLGGLGVTAVVLDHTLWVTGAVTATAFNDAGLQGIPLVPVGPFVPFATALLLLATFFQGRRMGWRRRT